MWPWFSQFMGGIRFTKYIPGFATATVNVESAQPSRNEESSALFHHRQ